VLDESIRWLVTNKRVEEAEHVLKRACRINRVNYSIVHSALMAGINNEKHDDNTEINNSSDADPTSSKTQSDNNNNEKHDDKTEINSSNNSINADPTSSKTERDNNTDDDGDTQNSPGSAGFKDDNSFCDDQLAGNCGTDSQAPVVNDTLDTDARTPLVVENGSPPSEVKGKPGVNIGGTATTTEPIHTVTELSVLVSADEFAPLTKGKDTEDGRKAKSNGIIHGLNEPIVIDVSATRPMENKVIKSAGDGGEVEKYTVLDVLRHPLLRKTAFIICYIW
jgi:hypothetical protein